MSNITLDWNLEDSLNLAYDVNVKYKIDVQRALIEVDKITKDELMDRDYVVDRLATHVEAQTDISYSTASNEIYDIIALNTF